jgi:hypothetical protein
MPRRKRRWVRSRCKGECSGNTGRWARIGRLDGYLWEHGAFVVTSWLSHLDPEARSELGFDI